MILKNWKNKKKKQKKKTKTTTTTKKKQRLLRRKLNPETNTWTTGKKRKLENHSKNPTRRLTEIPKSKNRESKREAMIRKSTRKFPEPKDTCCRQREPAERSAQWTINIPRLHHCELPERQKQRRFSKLPE